MGLQFLKVFLALFPFGMQVIIPNKKLSGIFSVSKKLFINSNNKSFNSSQKVGPAAPAPRGGTIAIHAGCGGPVAREV